MLKRNCGKLAAKPIPVRVGEALNSARPSWAISSAGMAPDEGSVAVVVSRSDYAPDAPNDHRIDARGEDPARIGNPDLLPRRSGLQAKAGARARLDQAAPVRLRLARAPVRVGGRTTSAEADQFVSFPLHSRCREHLPYRS